MEKEEGRASESISESKEKDERDENISKERSSIAALSLSTDTLSFSSLPPTVAQEDRVKREIAVIRARNLHMALGYFLISRWSTILSTCKEVGF